MLWLLREGVNGKWDGVLGQPVLVAQNAHAVRTRHTLTHTNTHTPCFNGEMGFRARKSASNLRSRCTYSEKARQRRASHRDCRKQPEVLIYIEIYLHREFEEVECIAPARVASQFTWCLGDRGPPVRWKAQKLQCTFEPPWARTTSSVQVGASSSA